MRKERLKEVAINYAFKNQIDLYYYAIFQIILTMLLF